MKKIFSLTITCFLLISLLSSFSAYAQSNNSVNNYSKVVGDLSFEEISDNKSFNDFNKNPAKYIYEDLVLMDISEIKQIEPLSSKQIMMNGVDIILYNKELNKINMNDLFELFGYGTLSIDNPENNEIVAVIISQSYADDVLYSFVCNSYVAGGTKINGETGEEIPIEISQNHETATFDKEMFLVNLSEKKESDLLAEKHLKTMAIPENHNVYIQAPENANHKFLTTIYYNNMSNGKLANNFSSKIYLWDKGRPAWDYTRRLWDVMTVNTMTARNDYMCDYIDVTVNGNYNSQKLEYFAWNTGNASVGASVSLGASLSYNGKQVTAGGSVSGGTSYSISTAGLDMANHPDEVNVKARWKGIGPVATKLTGFPFTGSLPRNNSLMLEGMCTLDARNSSGKIKGSRDWEVGIFEYTNFALWANRYYWYVNASPFEASFAVYK